MKRSRGLIVAIDGPAGAGKSTAARHVARTLGYQYLDTGAMYRAVALAASESGMNPDDIQQVVELAQDVDIEFQTNPNGGQWVFLDGRNVTQAIRSPEISRLTSQIATIPGVREAMAKQQRSLGRDGGVVVEGRDIGTVVFPDAEVKVFLSASEEERARRRWSENWERGVAISVSDVLYEQRERDSRDSSRDVAPLIPAQDAHILDASFLDPNDVSEQIVSWCLEAEFES